MQQDSDRHFTMLHKDFSHVWTFLLFVYPFLGYQESFWKLYKQKLSWRLYLSSGDCRLCRCVASCPSSLLSLAWLRGRAAHSVTARGVYCARVLPQAHLPFSHLPGHWVGAAHSATVWASLPLPGHWQNAPKKWAKTFSHPRSHLQLIVADLQNEESQIIVKLQWKSKEQILVVITKYVKSHFWHINP